MLRYVRWILGNTAGIRLNLVMQVVLGLLNVACALLMVWLSKMFIDETIQTGDDIEIIYVIAWLAAVVVAIGGRADEETVGGVAVTVE